MRLTRPRRAIHVAVALATLFAAVGLTIGLTGASGAVTQGVPAPYVNANNASDPHTKPCTVGGQNGICLFTSQDQDQAPVTTGYPSGQANSYPMVRTLGWFSTDGVTWQGPWQLMTESAYQSQGWVQTSSNPEHLWAPSAQQGGDGNWYLYVPDISDMSHPATSSFIGVSRSTNGPMGPYTPVAKLNTSGYGSDPDVVDTMSGRFGTGPYLFFADGDGSNCGGISMAPLDSGMTSVSGTPTRLTFTGIPASFGWCNDQYGRAHPYMEGPHVYNTSLSGWPAGTPGPFLMVVPIKPASTPAECATNVQGQPGTANELIAWLTANSVTGPWTYGGILMCGSQKEYTDQGSIIPVTTSTRISGYSPLLFVYADGAPTSAPGHHRTLHGECLFYGNGGFAGSIRTGGTQFSDSGAENDCLLGSSPFATALKSQVTGKFLSQNGNNTLTANRYAVGPWEQFFFNSGSPGAAILPTAGAGGTVTFNRGVWGPAAVAGLSTVPNTTTAITSTGTPGTPTLFNLTYSGAFLSLFSVQTGRGVRTLTDGTMRADVTGSPEQYTVYHH